jgi:hypothetical protein
MEAGLSILFGVLSVLFIPILKNLFSIVLTY